jgi:hypothetical protein
VEVEFHKQKEILKREVLVILNQELFAFQNRAEVVNLNRKYFAVQNQEELQILEW